MAIDAIQTQDPLVSSLRRRHRVDRGMTALLTVLMIALSVPSLALSAEVAERKRVEFVLRQQEQNLRAMFGQASVGVAQLETSGRFRLVNNRICSLVQRPTADLTQIRLQDLVEPDDLTELLNLLGHAVHTGEGFATENSCVLPDGSRVWLRINVSPMVDQSGAVRHLMAVAEDITARRHTEESLQQERDQLEQSVHERVAALQKAPGADGAFVYTAVTPGRYTVMVRTSPATPPGGLGSATLAPGALPPGPPNSLFGVADFTAAGTDIEGLTITLQPALHLTGRVVVDGTAAVDMGRLRVSLAAPNAGSTVVLNGVMSGRFPIPAATVKADGAFDMTGVIPGGYQLGVTVLPDTKLWLRSAMLGTRDLLDGPIDVATHVSNVTVTLTDRHTELNGRLETPAGQPATDYVVIVFSADRSHWRPQARRLVSARPATDGRFIVRDLPPGEYLIAALTDLDPDTWQTAVFLDQVVPAAIKIAIGEGETKTQNLRIAR
jgi:PAS domain S-box-containing protein